MKNKIYAILLLLSFLVVLSHEMIVHHHHDLMGYDFSTKYVHNDDDDHTHDKDNHHSHDSQQDQKDSQHNHPFPTHHHFSETNNFARSIILESNLQYKVITDFAISCLISSKLPEPTKLTINWFRHKLFLKPSAFNLEANALRGPPFIG